MRSNRNLLILGVLGLFILLFVASNSLLSGPAKLKLNDAQQVPEVFSNAAAYKDDSLVFSNGRQFVQYSYLSGKSKTLSDDQLFNGLDDITKLSVSADGRYLLFYDELAAAGGNLDSILRSEGSNPRGSYWWLYDVTNKVFRHLPEGTIKALLHHDSVYALDGEEGDSSITQYRLSDLAEQKKVRVTKSDNFFVSGDQFLLSESESGHVLKTTDGVVNTPLLNDGQQLFSLDSSGQYALTGIKAGSATQLNIYDISGNSQKTLANNVDSSRLSWGGENIIYGLNNNPRNLYIYNYLSRRTRFLKLAENNNSKKPLKPVISLPSDVILAGEGDKNYLYGNGLASIKLPDKYNKDIRWQGYVFNVEYFSDQSAFITTLDKAVADQERDQFYTQLKQDGFNPDLLDLRIALYTRPVVLD